jgi:hypothetical protein
MNASIQVLRALPIDMFDDNAPIQRWEREPVASLGDGELVDLCAQAIARPKHERNGNSFVLHAPLELLARAALLRLVSPEVRAVARRRVAEIAVRYANAGEEVVFSRYEFSDANAAIGALIQAITEGNQATAHNAARYLLTRKNQDEMRGLLIDRIAPMLGAAGHSPILLAEWSRAPGSSPSCAQLLLAPLHYASGSPASRLSWVDAVEWIETAIKHTSDEADGSLLWQALQKPVKILSASDSIAPTLLAADSSPEMIARLREPLSALALPVIEKVLLRVAAQSMLQDDPEQAPYGWTHCLTLPLALLANRDVSSNPRRLCAIAATYVYAFRATMSKVVIEPDWQPDAISRDESVDDTPQTAAALAFHVADNERQALRTQLANDAAKHRDAHVAKYTVACFDAATRDPEFTRHYLAAAAYLGAWWRKRDSLREKKLGNKRKTLGLSARPVIGEHAMAGRVL